MGRWKKEQPQSADDIIILYTPDELVNIRKAPLEEISH